MDPKKSCRNREEVMKNAAANPTEVENLGATARNVPMLVRSAAKRQFFGGSAANKLRSVPVTPWTVRVAGSRGLKKKLQIEKKRMVATTSTAVSELLEAFGNLIRSSKSDPNSAARSAHSHISSTEFIRPNSDKEDLKKSWRNHEEFMNHRK
jgi:hypothetical protein